MPKISVPDVLASAEGLVALWKPAGVPLEREGSVAASLSALPQAEDDLMVFGPRLVRGVQGPVVAGSVDCFEAAVHSGGIRGWISYSCVVAGEIPCPERMRLEFVVDGTPRVADARVLIAGRSRREENLALLSLEYEGTLTPSKCLASALGQADPGSFEKALALALAAQGQPLLGEHGRKSSGRRGWFLAATSLLLVHPIEGRPPMEVRRQPPEHFRKLIEFEARRCESAPEGDGRPTAYVAGGVQFCGLWLTVSPAVMVPRVGTEAVVRAAVRLMPSGTPKPSVLDLGTGSGCILIACLAAFGSKAWGVGVDDSESALEVARLNAHAHGLNSERATFVAADFSSISGQQEVGPRPFAVIVANPPYLTETEARATLDAPSLRHEPRHALVASSSGRHGLGAYKAIARSLIIAASEGKPLLDDGGVMVLEAPKKQAEISEIMSEAGLTYEGPEDDDRGLPRVMIFRQNQLQGADVASATAA